MEHCPDSKRGVLVVDDDEIVRRPVSELLSEVGYRVFLAGDATEAIACYRDHQDEIDLVLLDVSLPHVSAKECHAALREIDPGVVVLLSSGYGLDESALQTAFAGAAGFIPKPYGIDELDGRIRQALGD